MDESIYQLIKVACTVAGATATVVGAIAKPLWSKLNKLNADMETRVGTVGKSLDDKLVAVNRNIDEKLCEISETVEGIRTRVGEQNGRLGRSETWQKMHETHDDERHMEMQNRRGELHTSVTDLRKEFQDGMAEIRGKFDKLKP